MNALVDLFKKYWWAFAAVAVGVYFLLKKK